MLHQSFKILSVSDINQATNNSLAERHKPKHCQPPNDILKPQMNISYHGTTLHHMTHLVEEITMHVSDTLIRPPPVYE